jgi:hypothetical protein
MYLRFPQTPACRGFVFLARKILYVLNHWKKISKNVETGYINMDNALAKAFLFIDL